MATLLINNLPSQVFYGKSLSKVLYGKTINFGDLKVFGCTRFPCLRPYQAHKFQFHSEKCAYLGPSSNHKGHKCVTATGRVFISRSVTFNEEEFPFFTSFNQIPSAPKTVNPSPPIHMWFSNLPPPNQPSAPQITYSPAPSHQAITTPSPVSSPNIPDHSPCPNTVTTPSSFPSPKLPTQPLQPVSPSSVRTSSPELHNHLARPTLSQSVQSIHPSPQPASTTLPVHSMVTQGKADIFKLKPWISTAA